MVTLDSLSIVSSTPLYTGFNPPDVGAQEVVHQAREFEIYNLGVHLLFARGNLGSELVHHGTTCPTTLLQLLHKNLLIYIGIWYKIPHLGPC